MNRSSEHRVNSVVLVHGAFVDGSTWRGVYDILKQDGFNVSIVQNPTISLNGDVAAAKLVIDDQPGPVVLVGHSYGGAVITEAGTDPKVAALVYITAFAPDKGESVNSLIANAPPGSRESSILPPKDGYHFQDKAKFPAAFAGDVAAKTARFWADSQVAWGVDAACGQVTNPAWKTKPSWYLLATDDQMIPLSAQRFMSKRAGATTTEIPGSHAIYVSNPQAVATLIETAANSPKLAANAVDFAK
jgi:pimeloyl-ACP methyl ester carboxylesterase